jgi:hypothetical protein
MINLALAFLADFRPRGAHGGSREPWDGLRLENSAGCTDTQTRRPVLRPVRGYFVFLGPAGAFGF